MPDAPSEPGRGPTGLGRDRSFGERRPPIRRLPKAHYGRPVDFIFDRRRKPCGAPFPEGHGGFSGFGPKALRGGGSQARGSFDQGFLPLISERDSGRGGIVVPIRAARKDGVSMGNGVCGCGGVSEPSPAGEEAEWGGSFPGMASADVSGCCSEGRFGAGFRRRYGLRFGLRFGVRFGRVGGCRKRGEGGKEEGRKRGSKGASGRGALRVLPRKLRPSFPAGVDRTRHYVVVPSGDTPQRRKSVLPHG